MVSISDAPYSLSFLDGLGRPQDRQFRSRDKPHASEILRYLEAKLTPSNRHRTPIEEMVGADKIFLDRMADFGFMFEWALERSIRVPHAVGPEEAIELAWKSRMLLRRAEEVALEPQGELCLDNIYLTPDARNLQDRRGEEYKASWSSMMKIRDFLGNFRRWYWQIGCYAKVMEVVDYDLFVFWVNGDWKPPFPQIGIYRLKFEQEEVDRIWDMVRRGRDDMAKEKGGLRA